MVAGSEGCGQRNITNMTKGECVCVEGGIGGTSVAIQLAHSSLQRDLCEHTESE